MLAEKGEHEKQDAPGRGTARVTERSVPPQLIVKAHSSADTPDPWRGRFVTRAFLTKCFLNAGSSDSLFAKCSVTRAVPLPGADYWFHWTEEVKNQEGCSEGLKKAPMQPASPAFFEHHSQKSVLRISPVILRTMYRCAECNRNRNESLKKNQASLLWSIY